MTFKIHIVSLIFSLDVIIQIVSLTLHGIIITPPLPLDLGGGWKELVGRGHPGVGKIQNPENGVRIDSFISTKMQGPKHISRQIAGNGVSGPI